MDNPVFVLRVNRSYVAAFMVCKQSYKSTLILASAPCDALCLKEQDASFLAKYLSTGHSVVVAEQL